MEVLAAFVMLAAFCVYQQLKIDRMKRDMEWFMHETLRRGQLFPDFKQAFEAGEKNTGFDVTKIRPPSWADR